MKYPPFPSCFYSCYNLRNNLTRKEAIKLQDVLIIMLNKRNGTSSEVKMREKKGKHPVIYCRVAAQWAHDGKKMKYVNEKKICREALRHKSSQSILIQLLLWHGGKNQISHGWQLGFCKWNTCDLKPSETTINVDHLTPFLLTFVMFLPRDKSKM